VVAAAEVLHGRAKLGNTVAVIGGGIVGTEVGLVLAEDGHPVTFVEMLDEFMCGITFDQRLVYEERFKDLDVTVMTGQRLEAITETGITVIDRYGRPTEVPADTVVIAAGFRSNRELIQALSTDPALRVLEAGDCVRPRRIFDAIHEGHLAARLVDSL
jgi:2-enoate reductase